MCNYMRDSCFTVPPDIGLDGWMEWSAVNEWMCILIMPVVAMSMLVFLSFSLFLY